MPVQYGGELIHQTKELLTGKYELNKLTSREGSANVALTTAGGMESTFEIPTRPLNLARSVLRFTYTPTTAGAGNYNRIYMDCLSMIKTIELRSRSGQYLCNLQHVGNYTKVIWKPEMKYEKFMALENHGDYNTVDEKKTGCGAMLQKCNVGYIDVGTRPQKAAITNAGTLADLRNAVQTYIGPPPIAARRHDDNAVADNTAGEFSLVDVPYEEAKYFEGGADNDASPVIAVKLPLGMLFGTIFELDKTIGFNEILDMRIVWESTARTSFFGTDAKSISTGAAATVVGATVSNLNLFLAVETDPNVVLGVQQKIMGEGFPFKIEYPIAWKQALNGEQQNYVIKMNRSQGERIRRIYTSVFNSTENKNTSFDNDNRTDSAGGGLQAGKKVKTYYTTLDGTRLQQFDVKTVDNEDYMILKDKLKGSAILNSDVYHYNWFHVDTWDNNRPLCDKDTDGYEVSGLSLDTERRYEFVATTPNQIQNHYTFAILQRSVLVKGVEIMMS